MKFIFGGMRDPNNTSEYLRYKEPGDDSEFQGIEIDEGFFAIPIGGEVEMSAAERDRLLPYIDLRDPKDGDSVADEKNVPAAVQPGVADVQQSADPNPPTPEPAAPADDSGSSSSDSTIKGSGSSARS